MSLAGKKVGVLIESDFYEDEIFYYKHRFPEEGIELHFLTRLWGQPRITFHGHEYKVPFEASESFEGMSDADLQRIVREKLLGASAGLRPGEGNGGRQKVVLLTAVEAYLEQGWEWVAPLPDDRAILRTSG